MAETNRRKVKMAMVRYTDDKGVYHIVPRGETHDFPAGDWFDRHDALGAFAEPDEVLPQQGSVFTDDGTPFVNSDSSDEEIVAWVLSASAVEVATLLRHEDTDEEFAERVTTALEHVVDERQTASVDPTALSHVVGVAAGGETTRYPAQGATLAQQNPDRTPDGRDPEAEAEQEGDTGGEDAEVLDPVHADPADVVEGNLTQISRYLDAYPEEAQAILQAENERAESEDREPRAGLVRLVQAVAGSSGE
jgi:hypothetical protein